MLRKGVFKTRSAAFIIVGSLLAWSVGASAQTPLGGLPFPNHADFGDPGDRFGCAVSADGSWIVTTGSNREAFDMYERVASGWIRRQRIVPPTLGSTFIRTPLLGGNRRVTSRPLDTTVTPNPASPFEPRATLRLSVWHAGDRFGYGLGLASVPVDAGSATVLIVAASARDEGASVDQVVAYAFQHRESGSAWTQIQRITPADATSNDRFGQDLGVADVGASVLLIVGAQRHQLADVAGIGNTKLPKWRATAMEFSVRS